jgi:O-antigen/teichoic acid export membrane protein
MLLTSESYYEGYRVIPFVAVSIFLLGLQHRFQAGLTFYKKTHFIMYSIMFSGLLNVILNIIFVPKYGYMAAAVTTLISYFLFFMLVVIISRRYYVWKFPLLSLLRVMIAAGVMGILVGLLHNFMPFPTIINLFINVIMGIIIYCVMLIALHEVKTEELQMLRKGIDRLRKR